MGEKLEKSYDSFLINLYFIGMYKFVPCYISL